jgi:Glycosyl transferase family 2.
MGLRGLAKEFMTIDPRIRFFRQPVNEGPFRNFQFVLEQSRGEFFMWAADYDKREAYFIDRCLKEFAQNEANPAEVAMEARYFDDSGLFDFFPEGRPFYGNAPDSIMMQLSHMLRHNYGNLFYSLFRRSVLFRDRRSFFECVPIRSLNEISLFLFVVEQGGWKVIPDIGLYKKSRAGTVRQAKWQIEGGKKASLLRAGLIPFLSMLKYHYDAYKR